MQLLHTATNACNAATTMLLLIVCPLWILHNRGQGARLRRKMSGSNKEPVFSCLSLQRDTKANALVSSNNDTGCCNSVFVLISQV